LWINSGWWMRVLIDPHDDSVQHSCNNSVTHKAFQSCYALGTNMCYRSKGCCGYRASKEEKQ
jgi:hypothetical protein